MQVTLGVQTTDWVEITSPALPPGARVITSGQTALADGHAACVIRDQAHRLRSDAARRPLMNISDICIRRPVFTWVLVAIPVVLGVVAYFGLGVDLFPKVDFPVVSVTAIAARRQRRGDGNDRHQADRGSVNTVSGIDELRSTTREGVVVDRRPVPAGEERRRRRAGGPRQGLGDRPSSCPRGPTRPSSTSSTSTPPRS